MLRRRLEAYGTAKVTTVRVAPARAALFVLYGVGSKLIVKNFVLAKSQTILRRAQSVHGRSRNFQRNWGGPTP